MFMYIQVTIDLHHYKKPPIELQLSNQHMVKKLVDITWQTVNIHVKPRDGYWIRVSNKDSVFSGPQTLEACGITTGDRIEIL